MAGQAGLSVQDGRAEADKAAALWAASQGRAEAGCGAGRADTTGGPDEGEMGEQREPRNPDSCTSYRQTSVLKIENIFPQLQMCKQTVTWSQVLVTCRCSLFYMIFSQVTTNTFI